MILHHTLTDTYVFTSFLLDSSNAFQFIIRRHLRHKPTNVMIYFCFPAQECLLHTDGIMIGSFGCIMVKYSLCAKQTFCVGISSKKNQTKPSDSVWRSLKHFSIYLPPIIEALPILIPLQSCACTANLLVRIPLIIVLSSRMTEILNIPLRYPFSAFCIIFPRHIACVRLAATAVFQNPFEYSIFFPVLVTSVCTSSLMTFCFLLFTGKSECILTVTPSIKRPANFITAAVVKLNLTVLIYCTLLPMFNPLHNGQSSQQKMNLPVSTKVIAPLFLYRVFCHSYNMYFRRVFAESSFVS